MRFAVSPKDPTGRRVMAGRAAEKARRIKRDAGGLYQAADRFLTQEPRRRATGLARLMILRRARAS